MSTNSQDLASAFFEPASQFVTQGGADSLLRSLPSDQHPALDVHIVDQLRNFLSAPPDAIDLASTNIQRGHDLGLGTLNETRAALGLHPYSSFAELTSDPTTQAALAQAYGTVDKVDLWTGGLAENHAPGAEVGTTFQTIIADQFTALRDGDRLFFENQGFDAKTLQTIENTTLSDIIVRDTSVIICNKMPSWLLTGTAALLVRPRHLRTQTCHNSSLVLRASIRCWADPRTTFWWRLPAVYRR